MNVQEIVKKIKARIAAKENEIEKLKAVMEVLGGTVTKGAKRGPKKGSKRGRHKMSKEARAKIAEAQRKRWAKVKGK